jgi:hypothetical protein
MAIEKGRPLASLRQYAPLIAFALQMQAGGLVITGAHADETSASLYPGRYVANCKPAPIASCLCETDPPGQVSGSSQFTNKVSDQNGHIQDPEYLQMIEWLRLTCDAVARSSTTRR